jgi:TonB family protein
MRAFVEYRLTPDSWGVRITSAESNTQGATDQIRRAIDALEREVPLTGVRIGGAIQAPKKLKDVPPVYPAAAQEAGVRGVVILEARIDESGNVSDVRVLRSIPLLDQAAIDAVKQWQYTPTLLNGAAVPVVMTMTVNFTLRDPTQQPAISLNLGIVVPEALRLDGAATVRPRPVRPNEPALVFVKDKMAFGFVPLVGQAGSSGAFRIAVYWMNPNQNTAGQDTGGTIQERVEDMARKAGPPQLLGHVDVTPGAGIVYSPTTPSFGIELLSVSATKPL